MNILDQQLQNIKQKKRIGLMTHVVVGYPSLEETISLVKTMAENGADIIELQIPFSDPLADGPTIMKACEEALERGTKVKDAFIVMKTLSQQVSIPLLFMAYYNTIFNYGVEKFCKDAADAGCAGLIVPDMPLDEEGNEHFFKYCKKYNIHHIQVISPASTDERLKKNAKVANGFVYVTSRQGTTGAKDSLDPRLTTMLKKVRTYTDLPLAVGFGVSKKEHMQALNEHADIAVVGSAIIDVIKKASEANRTEAVQTFLTQLRS
jgi:tryptophan synthase alpha subunit